MKDKQAFGWVSAREGASVRDVMMLWDIILSQTLPCLRSAESSVHQVQTLCFWVCVLGLCVRAYVRVCVCVCLRGTLREGEGGWEDIVWPQSCLLVLASVCFLGQLERCEFQPGRGWWWWWWWRWRWRSLRHHQCFGPPINSSRESVWQDRQTIWATSVTVGLIKETWRMHMQAFTMWEAFRFKNTSAFWKIRRE